MLNFVKKEKPAGLISQSDLKRPKYKIIYACMIAFMVFMCVIVIVPALWIFVTGSMNCNKAFSTMYMILQRVQVEIKSPLKNSRKHF